MKQLTYWTGIVAYVLLTIGALDGVITPWLSREQTEVERITSIIYSAAFLVACVVRGTHEN